MTTHSKISASSMYRWSQCPGSVRLSENIESRSSVYAQEGTKAHACAEFFLLHNAWPEDADVDMIEAVSVYTQHVNRLTAEYPNCEVAIEKKFDLSAIHPGLYGTADCAVYVPDTQTLHVIDYKHGQGIPVEVNGNLQLMYYGLGALLTSSHAIHEVELTVVQPRCYHTDGPIRSHKFLAVELLGFAADLEELARATENPDAPLVPGDHCGFCPAAGVCPALFDKAKAVAKTEFGPNLPYNPIELGETLAWLSVLEGWIRSVREFAYAEAEHGRLTEAHGWKLVEKRAIRRWRDESTVYDAVKTILPRNEVFEEKLRSPAQLEKLLPKDRRGILDDLTVKESSGHTLAPVADKRQPIRKDAKGEFSPLA